MSSPAAPPDDALTVDKPTAPRRDGLDIFLDGAGKTVGAAFGVTLGAVVVLVIGTGLVTGAIDDVFDQDQYQDRIDAIGAVYRQGVKTKESLARNGITLPDEATCADAFRRTGIERERTGVHAEREDADGNPDEAFRELRRVSFINGCLGRPNNLAATPLPPAPTPSPSKLSS